MIEPIRLSLSLFRIISFCHFIAYMPPLPLDHVVCSLISIYFRPCACPSFRRPEFEHLFWFGSTRSASEQIRNGTTLAGSARHEARSYLLYSFNRFVLIAFPLNSRSRVLRKPRPSGSALLKSRLFEQNDQVSKSAN